MKTITKTLLLLAFLTGLVSTASAVSMGQVIGQVIERETRKPVAYAEIIFENNMDKITVTANEYGYYYADHMPTGKYQMRIVYNERTFRMNKVRVYDGYATEVDFPVSSISTLPGVVDMDCKEPIISSVQPTGVNLTNNSFNQPTQSLGDVLSMQPGVNVINGQIIVKGSNQVKVFIDGAPIMGSSQISGGW